MSSSATIQYILGCPVNKHIGILKQLRLFLWCLLLVGCGSSYIPEVEITAPHIEIAFSTEQGVYTPRVRGTVFLMAADGSHVSAFLYARDGALAHAPSWSPNGKCLAFTKIMSSAEVEKDKQGQEGLAIFCADGDNFVIPGGLYGAWSPDGEKIAYHQASKDGKGATLNVMTLATGQLEPLISLREDPVDHSGLRFSWSPNGDQIVYETQESSGDWSIYVMNADGTQPQRLTSGRRPDWSPTRPEIAFDDAGALWLIGIDGSQRRALTSGTGNDQWPSWSSDGQVLVFQSYRDGNGEIYRIARDGTGLLRLTDNPAWDGKPVWRPLAQP